MKVGTLAISVCRGCSTEFEYVRGRGKPREWCSDRCRKRQYDRPCIDCGARVDGTTPSKMQGRCEPCARVKRSAEVREGHIAAIQKWAAIHGEPPATADWSPQQAERKKDPARAQRWRDGGWPSALALIAVFGSWNAAIEAAGFVPRRQGGFAENHLRKRTVREALAA